MAQEGIVFLSISKAGIFGWLGDVNGLTSLTLNFSLFVG